MRWVVLFFFLSTATFGQNLIRNSSFEHGNDRSPEDYDRDLFGLREWKNFNSSDWFHTGDKDLYFGNYLSPPANTGDAYIGFGPCEGAQVELDPGGIPSYSNYFFMTSSLYYRMRLGISGQINYYLFKEKAGDIEDCMSDVAFNEGVKVTIDIPENRDDRWYYHEESIDSSDELAIIPISEAFEWFAIKGINTEGEHNHPQYVYVDDITVQFHDYCDHPCANNNKDDIYAHFSQLDDTGDTIEKLDTDIAKRAETIISNQSLIIANLVNVNEVLMKVVNRWGEVGEYRWFDYRGLSNANYDHNSIINPNVKAFLQTRSDMFSIVWDGRLNGKEFDGNNTYVIKLWTKNCGASNYAEFSLTQVGAETETDRFGNRITQHQPRYNAPETFSKNCCQAGRRIHNRSTVVVVSPERFEQSITYEGTYKNNTDRSYTGEAGEYIEVKPNTEIRAVSNKYFSLGINKYCQAGAKEKRQKTDHMASWAMEYFSENSVQIYPNPSLDGRFEIKSSDQILSVDVMSGTGMLLKSGLRGNEVQIENGSGLYLLLIQTKDERILKKVVVN